MTLPVELWFAAPVFKLVTVAVVECTIAIADCQIGYLEVQLWSDLTWPIEP